VIAVRVANRAGKPLPNPLRAARTRGSLKALCFALLATGVGVAGCGGGDVDSEKAEKEIQKGLAAQTKGDVKYVKCPGGVDAKKGGTFRCEALIPVNVTQVDDNGNIRWQITSFVGPPAGATGATGAAGVTGGAGATGGTGLAGTPGQPGAGAGGGNAVADTNVFKTYRNRSERYSISYPERWKPVGSGRDVNFSFTGEAAAVTRFVHVATFPGQGSRLPTLKSVRSDLNKQNGVVSVKKTGRATVGNGIPAVTAEFVYRAGAGRTGTQVIRRYIVARNDKRYVIELGAIQGLLRHKGPRAALEKKFARVLDSFRLTGSGS
jgi:Domain of unknown function (DUF4333)